MTVARLASDFAPPTGRKLPEVQLLHNQKVRYELVGGAADGKWGGFPHMATAGADSLQWGPGRLSFIRRHR